MSSKDDKCLQWRLDGMYYAYKIAKDDGLEALEDELKFRKATGIKTLITREEMRSLHQFVVDRATKAILTLSVMVLHDELDLPKEDMERFISRFNEKSAGIAENYTTWEEQMSVLNDEIGIEVAFE